MRLKSVYKRVISEKYADLSGDSRQAWDQMRENSLRKNDIYAIYELEYKLFKLSLERRRAGGWLPDQANLRALEWKTRLTNLMKESIEKLAKVIEGWAEYEEHEYIVPEVYPGGSYGFREDVYQKVREEYPELGPDAQQTEIYKRAYEEAKEDFIDEVWATREPYPTVEKTIKALKSPPQTISESIVLFHKALTTAHNNGSMLEYAVKEGNDELNKQFLDDLSNGKYIPKWDRELQQRSLVPREGLNEAEKISSHPTPEEVSQAIDLLDA